MDLIVALGFVAGLVTIALVVLGAVAAEHYSDRQRERAVLDPTLGPLLGELCQQVTTCPACRSRDLRVRTDAYPPVLYCAECRRDVEVPA